MPYWNSASKSIGSAFAVIQTTWSGRVVFSNKWWSPCYLMWNLSMLLLKLRTTLPKTNSSSLKSYLPKRKRSSSNPFSGAMLNFGGVMIFRTTNQKERLWEVKIQHPEDSHTQNPYKFKNQVFPTSNPSNSMTWRCWLEHGHMGHSSVVGWDSIFLGRYESHQLHQRDVGKKEAHDMAILINHWLSTRWWFQTFYFLPQSLGKWSNLTSICFQMGWFNHQLAWHDDTMIKWCFPIFCWQRREKDVQWKKPRSCFWCQKNMKTTGHADDCRCRSLIAASWGFLLTRKTSVFLVLNLNFLSQSTGLNLVMSQWHWYFFPSSKKKQLCVFLLYFESPVNHISGQLIATSHDLTPNGGLVREI